MITNGQSQAGSPPQRDDQVRAAPVLRKRSDQSRLHLINARSSATLTRRASLPERVPLEPPSPPIVFPPATPPAPVADGLGLRPEFIFDCAHCRQRIDATGMALFEVVQCPACGDHNAVPGRLNHYLLHEALGVGGMGTVYRACDEHVHRDVALMIIRRDLLGDDASASQFAREARAVARLDHPHIVRIHEIGDLRGVTYLVMELLTHSRLDILMAEGKTLPELLLLHTAHDIASALDSARRVGVIHGNIKPANVLYDDLGRAKLGNFGLSSIFLKRRGEVWGTPPYMPPERVLQTGEDWRSDQFSFGITLWCAFTGHPPFDGYTPAKLMHAIVNEPLPDLAFARPGVDPMAAQIVARMCAKDPGDRFPDYDELMRLLREIILEHKRSHSAPIPYPVGLEVLETREVG